MIAASAKLRRLLRSHTTSCPCGLAGTCDHGAGFCPCQTPELPRHRVIRLTPGVASYVIVFVPDAGSEPVGRVEHTTTGYWSATDADHYWLGQHHRLRRDAVRDVLVSWVFGETASTR